MEVPLYGTPIAMIANVQGGAVPAVGWHVFYETELIFMLLGELSGYSVPIRDGE
jgi:hypothetical protein